MLPMTTRDVGELLSEEHKKEKVENCAMLLRIVSNIRFLCRQGLPLRGHGDGSDSNFMQTLRFQGKSDHRISLWLERKVTSSLHLKLKMRSLRSLVYEYFMM